VRDARATCDRCSLSAVVHLDRDVEGCVFSFCENCYAAWYRHVIALFPQPRHLPHPDAVRSRGVLARRLFGGWSTSPWPLVVKEIARGRSRAAAAGLRDVGAPHASVDADGDAEHGALPEAPGELAGRALASRREGRAGDLLAREELDDDRVLSSALPEAARAVVRGAPEAVRHRADDALKPLGVDVDGKAGPRLSRSSGPDVEPDEAGGTEIARAARASTDTADAAESVDPRDAPKSGSVGGRSVDRLGSTKSSVAEGDPVPRQRGSRHRSSLARAELRRRAQEARPRDLVYLIVEPLEDGRMALETSWLPDAPEVTEALRPFGFRRHRDPTRGYRVVLDRADDSLGIVRLATKALAVLLAEG